MARQSTTEVRLLLLAVCCGSAWSWLGAPLLLPHAGVPRVMSSSTAMLQANVAECQLSRRMILLKGTLSAGVVATALGGGAPLAAAEDEFTVAFNASKGSLGIRLQELRYPRKKGGFDPFSSSKVYEAVIVSSVDPTGQGVKQAKGQVRPGLVVKAVQGRSLAGLKAKDAIKQLSTEIEARADPQGLQAIREDGLPELVEITFSSECVAVPEEPSVCYNSVMPIESVLGVQPK